ncbi:MAG: Flp pilus assembly complex ATPase component TadA [Elusimicrobia bacterium]|nr:Flp pilus assembly complex ATPase component TadA [Elusimicrobiota bacterium]
MDLIMNEKPLLPRVITFSGPKEGVGKTSIALNAALAWSNYQKRNVLIVPLDPSCASDQAAFLDIKNPPSISEIIKLTGRESLSSLGSLLKGKIPLSQWGVGVLPLAGKRSDIARMAPDLILPIFSKLSQNFDIFIDVDSYFPMQVFAFDISDNVFWVTNPNVANINSTSQMFREINNLHFSTGKFDIVVNFFDFPGAVTPKELEKIFKQMNKQILAFMPWEDNLAVCSNQNKILITEHPNSQWIKMLRVILGKIDETEPIQKQWTTNISAQEFSHGSDMLWRPLERENSQAIGKQGSTGQRADKTEVSPFWEDLKVRLHTDVVAALELERIKISEDTKENEEVKKKVDSIINNLLQKEKDIKLTRDQRIKFIDELLDEILGLGPLEEIMRNPDVTEIMVNSPDRVFIEKAGKLILTKHRFRDNDQVMQVIKRIVAPLGKRIDESVPLVDARLKDGSRVNAIIPPLAVSGPTLTIRRFSAKPFTDEQLIKKGSITANAVQFLKACVKLRKDIIVSGGTGTGKTTFLNMLSGYIPEDERIITVEDTAELRLQQEHWVRLESRPPNIEGKGEVSIRDLVKNCLRMRPDRIIVGEVRSSEALDMLQAMNTGHEGSLATIHANTPRDALTRLEAMCLMAGADLPIWALREMIASAVHIVIQLTRFSDGTRKITAISEITGREENQILTHDLFKYKQTGIDRNGKVEGIFQAVGEPPKFFKDFKTSGIDMPVDLFWTDAQKMERSRQ